MEMIKRKVLPKLINHLKKKEITMLIGPRQAGKTTLMLELKKQLEKQKKRTIHLNLDKSEDKPHFDTQRTLLGFLDLQFGGKEAYVFIDEIQRVENAGLFLKGIYDRKLNYKFVVSGSGSIELKENVVESLVGRKRVFKIPTITFEEFVNHRTDYRYETKLADFFQIDKGSADSLLGEYLKFGGYPRVVLGGTTKEKVEEMDEIYEGYIERDIEKLLNVRKSESFSDLVTIISSQAGALVNYSELSNTLNIEFETVRRYLWYLSKTFVLHRVNPYFTNVRKELTKMPVFYFYDLGMRNYALNRLSYFEPKPKKGFLFQNFVHNVLWGAEYLGVHKINFWRTKGGSEVDFVIRKGVDLIPVEVKASAIEKVKLSRSLSSFIKKYKPKQAFIVGLKCEDSVDYEGTTVRLIPYYKLLFGLE